MSDNRVYEGEIFRFEENGNRAWGLIASTNLGRLYFNLDEVERDNIGRTIHVRPIGSLVLFRVVKNMHRGEPSARAVDVTPVFGSDVADPESHRECTLVEHIVGPSSVFLRREGGDRLHLRRCEVAENHRDRFGDLRVGHHVWCGVRAPESSKFPTWSATDAMFYSQEEEQDLR